GAVVAPFGKYPRRGKVLEATVELAGGRRELSFGEGEGEGQFARVELAAGEEARAHLRPARGVDVGEGPGREREVTLRGGEAGIVFDCRGRPLVLPSDPEERRGRIASWLETLGLPRGKT
ncbi:MAG: glutamate mutase L, partial [Planctomycetota bacterium]